jgi:hypothetical protein
MASRALDQAQRLIWGLVTAPEGVEAGLEAIGDTGAAQLRAVVSGDARLDAASRLTVYANAYFFRIHDALKEDFGALHRALGEAAFHNLVTVYLFSHPPTHPSLRYAGKHLPGFLATDRAAAPFRERCPWAADLAALEWALLEAFDAPDAPVLSRDDLAAAPAGAWGDFRFSLTPSLQTLTLAWPVETVRAAYDRGTDLPAPPPGRTHLRVWRREERVFYRPMPPLEAEALGLVRAGESFGRLCGHVAAEAGEGEAPQRALGLLERWLADHLLAALDR